MRLDEAGYRHPAVGIENQRGGQRQALFNADEAAIDDAEIAQAVGAAKGDILDQDIQGHCGALGVEDQPYRASPVPIQQLAERRPTRLSAASKYCPSSR